MTNITMPTRSRRQKDPTGNVVFLPTAGGKKVRQGRRIGLRMQPGVVDLNEARIQRAAAKVKNLKEGYHFVESDPSFLAYLDRENFAAKRAGKQMMKYYDLLALFVAKRGIKPVLSTPLPRPRPGEIEMLSDDYEFSGFCWDHNRADRSAGRPLKHELELRQLYAIYCRDGRLPDDPPQPTRKAPRTRRSPDND